MAQLERLRTDPQLMGQVSIWPFDTDFDQRLDSSIVLAEIYPSWGLTLDPSIGVRDRAQVEAQVHRFAALDRAGELGRFMGFPSHLDESAKASALRDEGWIFGAGHREHGR